MILALVDVETTGFEAGKHRVVEAGVQLVDVTKDAMVVKDSYVFKTKIDRRIHAWTEGAFEVSGYTDEEWKDSPMVDSLEAKKGWAEYVRIIAKYPLCSQNVIFDMSFMRWEAIRHGVKPTWARRYVDIMSFSFLAAEKLGLVKWGLHDVYSATGGPPIQEHRSMADIERGKYVMNLVKEAFFKA